MTAVATMIGFVAVPIVTSVGGSVVAASRPAGERVRSVVQHVAAGLVFAAASLELLPDLIREHSQTGTVIGFVAGVVVMLLLGRLSDRYEALGGQRAAVGVVLLIAFDMLLDGVLMGVAFSEQARQGRVLTIALTFELAFLGLSVATALQTAGASRRQVVAVTTATSLTLPVGALLGIGPLASLPVTPFAAVLAFGTVALLYLVTEELLAEAHEVKDTPLATAMFFVGFLGILLISLSAGGPN
ncbi:MAG: ZIP family metal transporter [Acidimicrobiia bacterium]